MRQRLIYEILFYVLICDKRGAFILNNLRKRKNVLFIICKYINKKHIKM